MGLSFESHLFCRCEPKTIVDTRQLQTPSTVIWEKRGRYPPQRLDLPRFLYVFVDDVYKDDARNTALLWAIITLTTEPMLRQPD